MQKGTSGVKGSRAGRAAGAPRFTVMSDGYGVASRAGTVMVRELAMASGMSDAVTGALADTYSGPWLHEPGQVFCDLAVAVADGATSVDGIERLRERDQLHGPLVASDSTALRLLDRIDVKHVPAVAAARARARERAWAAGAAPAVVANPDDGSCEEGWLHIDVDASIVTCDSEKENAAATWKRTYGHHPLFACLDRPEVCSGEFLAGLLRPGNAGSNTASDHITVLDAALEQLPTSVRLAVPSAVGGPGRSGVPKILIRSDSAGATHAFAAHCRTRGVGFSFGYAVDAYLVAVADAITACQDETGRPLWQPAINADGSIRDGGWVVEADAETAGLFRSSRADRPVWPAGTRLILRKERPHPGAQLDLHNTTRDQMRLTAFITDTPSGIVPGQVAGLDLRHRQHARIEDRIKDAKATGLANLPAWGFDQNQAWIEIVAAATDLICWTKLLAFKDVPALARATPKTFRERVLHIAAKITRTGRRILLHLDASSRYATAIAACWTRLRHAFTFT